MRTVLLALLLATAARAAVPPPTPEQLAAMRATLHQVLQRRIALTLALTRESRKVLREIEGRAGKPRDEKGLVQRLGAGRKQEEQFLIWEGDLLSVPGITDARTTELSGRLSRNRGTLSRLVARLSQLLPLVTAADRQWWEKPQLVVRHVPELHPKTPADLRTLMEAGHPESIDELLGAVGSVDRRYLPTK